MKRFRASYIVTYLIVLVGLVIGGTIATLMFGLVEGTEFSPQTFKLRKFSYFQLPLVGAQVTGLHREADTLPAASTVAKWIHRDSSADRWDLVGGRIAGVESDPGDASILLGYLQAERGGDPEWIAWSNEHADLAPALWRVVSQLAQLDAYLVIPDVFDEAMDCQDWAPADFAARLRKRASASLRDMAAEISQQGEAQRANEFLMQADAWAQDAEG